LFPNAFIAALLVIASFTIAMAALLTFAYAENRNRRRLLSPVDRGAAVFLFQDETLLDATKEARQLLDAIPRQGSQWFHLSKLLAPRFPDLSNRFAHLAEDGEVSLTSSDENTLLNAVWLDGIARITLTDIDPADPHPRMDGHTTSALESELKTLRENADTVPYLTWRENSQGDITWVNRAYLDITETRNPQAGPRPWPPEKLFSVSSIAPDTADEGPWRTPMLQPPDTPARWFDVRQFALGDETLFCATSADAIVQAEQSLSEFVTTLTKTFAHLPIGLAIFDRARQLALFNPALTDLTVLPAGFLCARPTLFAFLDRLRESRMMPEPKDYKSWRQRMTELEAMAVNGTYEETWALPTGQTFRVTGRPQPDGAVAFLFEDISAEISLTRRFKAELEMGQAALDCLDDAVAVFSPGGVLSISNTAYANLWGRDPMEALTDLSVGDAAHSWASKCSPSPIWNKIIDFTMSPRERVAWVGGVTLKDGRAVRCKCVPIGRGGTMVFFSTTAAHQAVEETQPGVLTAAKA